MDLNELKHGKQFVCYWFEDGECTARVCKFSPDCDTFFQKDKDGDWVYIANAERFFKHTACVSE